MVKRRHDDGLCECRCHSHEGVRHIVPCCELTYSIYLNKEGEFINDKWIEAKHAFNKWVDEEYNSPLTRSYLKKELLERKFPNPDETIWECADRLGIQIK